LIGGIKNGFDKRENGNDDDNLFDYLFFLENMRWLMAR